MTRLFQTISILFIFSLFACGTEDEPVDPESKFTPELSASVQSLNFSPEGGSEIINVNSNTIWTISSTESWCTSSVQSSKANASVTIRVQSSYEENKRTATLTVSAANVNDVQIQVTQEAYIPDSSEMSYITPDNTGMNSDAKTLASKIYLGWNLGNTLEAIGGETAWGNPKATNDLIVSLKNQGINAVRIPCSWDQYLEDQVNYRIKKSWLERVKQVVDYCVDNDMYAILNIHWDGGWMEENCTTDKQEEVNAKLATIWKQIAITFRDYDEHLLFAGANEPNADDQQQANVLKVYMQTFVNTVRATGGKNAYRNLIIQTPRTDIDKAISFMTMPDDDIQNRLFAEVHYYTPWQFCGMNEDADWGNAYYFWGTNYHMEGSEGRFPNWDCEESYVDAQFQRMKTKFIEQGIPVILGEYGAIRRTLSESTWQEKHNESRAYFNKYITMQAKNYGLVPFYWDEGSLQEFGFGFMNRSTNAVGDQQVLDGLLNGAENGTYPY